MIETINLTKEYNGVKAVDNVNVKIENGKIYGLIGRNGAGKTTFIRMIAGLIFPTSGTILFNGKSSDKELAAQRKRMSFIVETPYFNPNLTAYENMEMQRISRGIPSEGDVSKKWLEFVGLGDTGKKKSGKFSLGMRQRLGIAMAMIAEPEILFLDEPINGLDPIGIIQMRDLISQMNKEYNTTIVVSSHILSELYHIATDYIIIDNGVITDQFSKEHFDEMYSQYIEVGVNNIDKSIKVISDVLHYSNFKTEGSIVKIYDESADIELVSSTLIKNDIMLHKLLIHSMSLEDFFISKTQQNGGV